MAVRESAPARDSRDNRTQVPVVDACPPAFRCPVPQAGPGESGFRLMPTGDYALEARLALAARAERSLDVQYYQLQRDSVGLRFLRELGDAARRGVRVRLLVDDLTPPAKTSCSDASPRCRTFRFACSIRCRCATARC